jgi:hypothetical protein
MDELTDSRLDNLLKAADKAEAHGEQVQIAPDGVRLIVRAYIALQARVQEVERAIAWLAQHAGEDDHG